MLYDTGMQKVVKSEILWITLIALTMLALSIAPLLIQWKNTPNNAYFIPIHNSISDYPYYVSIIREGIDGSLKVYGQYTTEAQSGGYVHLFYLMLGWFGKGVGIHDAHAVYLSARIFFGILWALVIYLFVRIFTEKKINRIITFLIALTSASFPNFTWVNGGVDVQWYMTWWSELNPIIRFTFLPHYLLGHILLTLSVISVWQFDRTKKIFWWFLLALLGWIAGFVHPPSLIILIPVVPLWALLCRRFRTLLWSSVALGLASTSLLLLKGMISRFPWNLALPYEQTIWYAPTPEYLLALGPVFVLAIMGLIAGWKKRETILLALWAGISIMLLDRIGMLKYSPNALLRELSVSNIRFLQMAPWIPMSILASKFIAYLSTIRFGRIISAAFIGAYLIITFIGYPSSLKEQVANVFMDERFVYPSRGWISAIQALDGITKPGENILALPLAGRMIPTYTNRRVYVNSIHSYTKDLDRKLSLVWNFYHGTLPVCDGYHLVKDNGITAVFEGYDEKDQGNAAIGYPFLALVRSFDTTNVYRFTDVKPAGCK